LGGIFFWLKLCWASPRCPSRRGAMATNLFPASTSCNPAGWAVVSAACLLLRYLATAACLATDWARLRFLATAAPSAVAWLWFAFSATAATFATPVSFGAFREVNYIFTASAAWRGHRTLGNDSSPTVVIARLPQDLAFGFPLIFWVVFVLCGQFWPGLFVASFGLGCSWPVLAWVVRAGCGPWLSPFCICRRGEPPCPFQSSLIRCPPWRVGRVGFRRPITTSPSLDIKILVERGRRKQTTLLPKPYREC
jgi:hypothetical protein